MQYSSCKRDILKSLEDMIYKMDKNFGQMDLENASIKNNIEEIQENIKRHINSTIDKIDSYRFIEE